MRPLSTPELEDLHVAMMERMEGTLLRAITLANEEGKLGPLVEMLCMSDLMKGAYEIEVRPTRIVVVGDSVSSESKLRSIARKSGFNLDLFEFALGYTELKHFNFSKLRNKETYKAILVGPMPHSTPGKCGSSSFIAEAQRHPEEYPPVIELRDSSGLKITNNSFAKGLEELMQVKAE